LRGQLLLSGPSLVDPNFRHTVILLGNHDDDGAMGVILNRRSPVAVADAVPPLAALVGPDELVFLGGPVQPEAVLVLADFAEPERAGELVLESVGFLPGELDDAAAVGEMHAVRVFAGYAGWARGQLESELAEGSWLVFPALSHDIFTSRPDELWSDVLRREGGKYALLALLPSDPRVN
jgi:putative transcriptional regulator